MRKRHGRLLGYDFASIRKQALQAFERLEKASRNFTANTPEQVGAGFRDAERMASVHFADAYREGVPVPKKQDSEK